MLRMLLSYRVQRDALSARAAAYGIAASHRFFLAMRDLCRAFAVVTRAALQRAGLDAVARAVSGIAACVMGLRCRVAA